MSSFVDDILAGAELRRLTAERDHWRAEALRVTLEREELRAEVERLRAALERFCPVGEFCAACDSTGAKYEQARKALEATK